MGLGRDGRPPRSLLVLVAVGAVGAIAQALLLLASARHGFDFTDEGFYLNAIAHDSEGSVHVSAFGPVYRAITWPLGLDVTALRWFNVISLFAAGALLGWALLSRTEERGSKKAWIISALVLVLAAPTLGFFGSGLLTPSYNSLAALGILLVAGGAVLAIEASRRPHELTAALLIGLGGVATFLGKPSAALATAIVVAAALGLAGPTARRTALGGAVVATLALLVVSWPLTGSPVGIVPRVIQAASESRELGSGHDLASAFASFGEAPPTSTRGWQLFGGTALATFAWTRAWLHEGPLRHAWLGGAILVGAVTLWGAEVEAVGYTTPSRALPLLGAPVGLLAASLLTRQRRPERSTLLLSGALLALPHAWVFGSNTDYWRGASLLGVLWLAGAGVLLTERVQSRAFALAVVGVPGLLLTSAVIGATLADPYRQVVPVFDQETPAMMGDADSLRVAPDFARAISGFRQAAASAGFEAGTPIIDLSGQLPGLVFAVDGRAAGAPWIIGGYPGSDRVASRTLSHTACATLAASWLILEPAGTRSIDPAAMSTTGLNLEDWEHVATETVQTDPSPPREIQLLAPATPISERVARCEAAR